MVVEVYYSIISDSVIYSSHYRLTTWLCLIIMEEEKDQDPEFPLSVKNANEDGSSATFVMKGEGHTLGNLLRYLLNQK